MPPPDPIDEFLVAKNSQLYEEARQSVLKPLPRKGFWDYFWDIPYIHAILITLLILCWSAFAIWIRRF